MSGKKMIKSPVATYYEYDEINLQDFAKKYSSDKYSAQIYDDGDNDWCFQIYENRIEDNAEYLHRLSREWGNAHHYKKHKLRRIVETRMASDEQELEYLALLKEECPKTIEELEAWSEKA